VEWVWGLGFLCVVLWYNTQLVNLRSRVRIVALTPGVKKIEKSNLSVFISGRLNFFTFCLHLAESANKKVHKSS
jgi:hypothetical protein